jgi:hypothetical protein
VTLRLGAAPDTGRRLTWLVVVLAGLALGAGLFLLLSRRGAARGTAAPRGDGPDALAAQIAALDERFEGREAETDPGEWARYRERRAELKRRLQDALARAGAP